MQMTMSTVGPGEPQVSGLDCMEEDRIPTGGREVESAFSVERAGRKVE